MGCKKWFVPKGTGGVQANAAKQEQNAAEQAALIKANAAKTAPLWDQFYAMNQQLQPTYQGLQEGLQTGSYGGSMPAAWTPSASLMGQINPTLDPTGTGQQVQAAYQRSSTQSLADQYRALQDQLSLSNARRGITNTSFAPSSLTSLAIQRAQQEAANSANALTQGLATTQSLQNQQASGAMNQAGLEQQGYRNQLAQFWNALQALQAQANNMATLGNPNTQLTQLQSLNPQYGQIGQNYAQIGANQMAGLNSLISAAAQAYGMGGA